MSRTRSGRPTSTSVRSASTMSRLRSAADHGLVPAAADDAVLPDGAAALIHIDAAGWSAVRGRGMRSRRASSWAPSPRRSADRAGRAPAFGHRRRSKHRVRRSIRPGLARHRLDRHPRSRAGRGRARRPHRRPLDRRRPGTALVGRTVIILGDGAPAPACSKSSKVPYRSRTPATTPGPPASKASGGGRPKRSSAMAPRSTSPASRTSARRPWASSPAPRSPVATRR